MTGQQQTLSPNFHLHAAGEKVTGSNSIATQAAQLCHVIHQHKDRMEAIVQSFLSAPGRTDQVAICDAALDELLFNDYQPQAAKAVTKTMIGMFPDDPSVVSVTNSKTLSGLFLGGDYDIAMNVARYLVRNCDPSSAAGADARAVMDQFAPKVLRAEFAKKKTEPKSFVLGKDDLDLPYSPFGIWALGLEDGPFIAP